MDQPPAPAYVASGENRLRRGCAGPLKWALLFGCGGFIVLVMATLVLFSTLAILGPEVSVVAGPQVSREYVQTIRDLGLLDSDEKLAFFYSDALYDIKGGMYFVTDRHLVAYSSDWEPPALRIPHSEISGLVVEYNPSFFEDTMLWIEYGEGLEVGIPVSSDGGGDRRFYQYLEERITPPAAMDDASTTPSLIF